MRNRRINHYLNTFCLLFIKPSRDRRQILRFKFLSLSILIVTLYFGAAPFNFISRNDISFDPDSKGLHFNRSNLDGESDQRAIAYTIDTLSLDKSQPISVFLELTPERIPNGLGTLIEFYDGQLQPPLIVSQWQTHLVIRSRRADSINALAYREIGLRDCLATGETVSLLIASSENETLIYVNGELAIRKAGFDLIDPNASTRAQMTVGSNASGEQPWIGQIHRLTLFDKRIHPANVETGDSYPLVEYSFDIPSKDTIANRRSKTLDLKIPSTYSPLVRKRFSPLASWNSNHSGQYSDAWLNVFGFVPIGLVFYVLLTRSRCPEKLRFLGVLVGCFALSFAIEYAQIYLPSRNPSHLDLLGNTLGGLLAALIAWSIEKRFNKRSDLSIE